MVMTRVIIVWNQKDNYYFYIQENQKEPGASCAGGALNMERKGPSLDKQFLAASCIESFSSLCPFQLHPMKHPLQLPNHILHPLSLLHLGLSSHSSASPLCPSIMNFIALFFPLLFPSTCNDFPPKLSSFKTQPSSKPSPESSVYITQSPFSKLHLYLQSAYHGLQFVLQIRLYSS